MDEFRGVGGGEVMGSMLRLCHRCQRYRCECRRLGLERSEPMEFNQVNNNAGDVVNVTANKPSPLTAADELVIRELYRDKMRHAYCTSTVPLRFHRWNGRHPVEQNTTHDMIPAGTTLKIVMVSRFDDCGLTDDLAADRGYHCRVSWDSGDIKDIRWEP